MQYLGHIKYTMTKNIPLKDKDGQTAFKKYPTTYF